MLATNYTNFLIYVKEQEEESSPTSKLRAKSASPGVSRSVRSFTLQDPGPQFRPDSNGRVSGPGTRSPLSPPNYAHIQKLIQAPALRGLFHAIRDPAIIFNRPI
jgi:hypothetical protein